MKRFLSWLILPAANFITNSISSIAISLILYINEFSDNNFVYIIEAIAFLGLIITVIYYGSSLAVSISESVCKSRNGMRYNAFSILVIISNMGAIDREILREQYSIYIIVATYSVAIIFAAAIIIRAQKLKQNIHTYR